MTTASSEESEETLLLLDSEVIARHELAEYLRDCGYRVIEAASAAEGQAVIGKDDLPINLMLCGLNGADSEEIFSLIRDVRTQRPGLEVLLAGNVEKAANLAAEICDDGPALARPYDPRLVLDRIRRRLAQAMRSELPNGS